MDNFIAIQCKNCGNNEHSRFKRRGRDFICNCCGSWYRSKDMEDPHCESGYAMLTTYHFDEAKHIFQNALTESPDNIDALWGWLLAEYRIIYVKGFYNDVIEPIYCFDRYEMFKTRSVQNEVEYKKILNLLANDPEFRNSYREKAEKIDRSISSFKSCKDSTDNDVFICVKISTSTEKLTRPRDERTKDFEVAEKLYNDLKSKGMKPFFSFYTLKNQVNSDDLIWTNLVKSKKMVLIGSQKDYFDSIWVKSEWKRWLFLDRIKDLYILTLPKNNQSPYDILPTELSRNQIYTPSTYNKLLHDICEEKVMVAKKRTGLKAFLGTVSIFIVLLLAGTAIFAMPKLFENNNTNNLPSASTQSSITTTDNSKLNEAQIDSIIREAEAMATNNDYEGALNKVQTGLISYPNSAELQTKATEYSTIIQDNAIADILEEATALASNGDYEGALNKVERGLATYPNSAKLKTKVSEYKKVIEDAAIAEILSEAKLYADVKDYKSAIEVIEKGLKTYSTSTSLKNKKTEYTNAQNAQIKADVLERAKSFADIADYETAMSIIRNAQNTYGNNADYQSAYSTYQQKYVAQVKSRTLEEAQTLADAGDYVSATKLIESALTTYGDDIELTKKLKDYQSLYVADILSQVDTSISEKKYDDAIKLLNNAIEIVPNSTDLINKLNYIKSIQPVLLSSIEPFNGGYNWNNGGMPQDSFGNIYTDYTVISSQESIIKDGTMDRIYLNPSFYNYHTEYYVNSKYSTLTMTIAPYIYTGESSESYVEIYVDNNLFYKTSIITRKTQPFTCEIDLTNATYVKIVSYVFNNARENTGAIILSDMKLWPK